MFFNGSVSKESACNAGDLGSISWPGRSPGEGNGNPLQSAFLPGKSHGQRSLVGCSPYGASRARRDLATKPPQQWVFCLHKSWFPLSLAVIYFIPLFFCFFKICFQSNCTQFNVNMKHLYVSFLLIEAGSIKA